MTPAEFFLAWLGLGLITAPVIGRWLRGCSHDPFDQPFGDVPQIPHEQDNDR